MGKHRKYLGHGWTPVNLYLIVDQKGWDKTLERFPEDQRIEYPGELHHASITHFPAQDHYAPVSLLCIKPEYLKGVPKYRVAALLAHEAVHYAQRVEDIQGAKLDEETEAYIVQMVVLKAVEYLFDK